MDYSAVRISKDNSYQALLYNDRKTGTDNIKGDIEQRR